MKLDLEDPRLTAYALGELDERERSELEGRISESPEACELVGEIRETAALLHDELRSESTLQLTKARRERIEDRLTRKPWWVIPRRWKLAASLAAVALIALLVYSSMVPEPEPGPVLVRFQDPDGGSGAQPFAGDALALSPDGAHLVFRANGQLYRGEMDTRVAVPIRGTEGATNAFFSPDGQWVGFFADGILKKVALAGPFAGRPPLNVCDAESHRGASWGPDDFIVFASDTSSGLMRVLASGGTPEPVTTLESGEMRHVWPELLPGGEAVLFSVDRGNPELSRIAVQSLRTGERRTLVAGSGPHYAPTGHIVFMRADSIWAVPFDRERLEVTGEAVPILEGAQVNSGSGLSDFALSRNGSLVYVSPGSAPTSANIFVFRNWHEELKRRVPS